MEVVRANGLEIAYKRVGEGPPLVLVHGAAVDSRLWRPQLATLGDEFTVVAWEEPGAGRSSDVPADFALADYANCLAALIDALDLGPAHVAGLSWGGTVALELYRHDPEPVATLILVDTYAGWKGSLPAEEVRARVEDGAWPDGDGERVTLTPAAERGRGAAGTVRLEPRPGGRAAESCAACPRARRMTTTSSGSSATTASWSRWAGCGCPSRARRLSTWDCRSTLTASGSSTSRASPPTATRRTRPSRCCAGRPGSPRR